MAIDIPKEIPNRSDFPQVKKLDRQIIRAAVLLGLSNQEAYKLYHPECWDGRGGLNEAGKRESGYFWSYGKNRDYREAYEKTVEEFFNGGKSEAAFNEDENIDGDALARKILSDLAAMIKNGRIQDYEVLKIATDILNKYGVLKGSEEKQEAPRRYIPLRCGECEYRSFVESYVETGEIENTCLRCKALDIAKENGFRYDPKTLLKQPTSNNSENQSQ